MDFSNGLTKQCGICFNTFPATLIYFSKSSHRKDGLYTYCKICDNKKRTIRYKTKVSHNIPKRCKFCEGFFYAELTRIRQGIGKFCSKSCSGKYYSPKRGRKCLPFRQNDGETNPMARLTKEKVIEIKIALNNNTSRKEICEKYNITSGHVSNIKVGRTWKNIEIKENYEK